ncbi:MAG: hypothetical protein JWO30_4942 [Fibrobacteres bacterium]|nr:hypothetical protein [Fibrobacterota bacterium]
MVTPLGKAFRSRAGKEIHQAGQRGFSIVYILGILLTLSILGLAVFRDVGTDITHSGNDWKRIRAEFAAESAVQWGLAELSNPRPDQLPYTLATHAPDGVTLLTGYDKKKETSPYPAKSGIRVFRADDLASVPQSETGKTGDGWLFLHTHSRDISVSSGKDEILSFKVWYPDDSTLRITGKASVDGSTSEVELVSTLRKVATRI